MLQIGDKQVSQFYVGTKAVAALYIGARLVWEAVSSCFGSGVWISARPWKGTDAWR